MKAKRRLYFSLIVVLLSIPVIVACCYWGMAGQRSPSNAALSRLVAGASAPFLHRPYYGSQSVLSRTVSFVDHDKPWYVPDGLFVRFDGQRWSGDSIVNCARGVSCYDGHNGYDLNLWFEPVLSAAAGIVTRAGWYNPLDHNSSFGLWVAIDHGNGFTTAYGHLSAITVAVGDHVGVQWQIGTSGTTGASTGPHLHMSTYYLPYWQATDPFGWRGNYPDPNVVPDRYLWVNRPGTAYTVPQLSAYRNAVYPGAILVDDGGAGWSSTGTWYRAATRTGINGFLHWTPSTSNVVTATATWRPNIPANGYYEVGVFVDDSYASSSWATFTVYSADPNHPGVELRHNVYVDQSHIGLFQGPFGTVNTGPQWISIGTYYFRKSMNGRVFLSNATGVAGQEIAADGVEFARIGTQLSTGTPAMATPGSASVDTAVSHLAFNQVADNRRRNVVS